MLTRRRPPPRLTTCCGSACAPRFCMHVSMIAPVLHAPAASGADALVLSVLRAARVGVQYRNACRAPGQQLDRQACCVCRLHDPKERPHMLAVVDTLGKAVGQSH